MFNRSVFLALCLIAFNSQAPAFAQGRGGQPPSPAVEQGTPPASRIETAGPAEEKISQTSHTMRLDGRDIKYTTTAGTLPIRLDDGYLKVPEGPGLGVEVDEAIIEKYRIA